MDTQINLDNGPVEAGLRHGEEYLEFITWTALPVSERHPRTQKELASKFNLSEWTLSQWKLRDGFWVEVGKLRKEWGKDKTPEVLAGLLEKAKAGDASAARLWLEYVEGHIPRSRSDISIAPQIYISEEIAKKNKSLS